MKKIVKTALLSVGIVSVLGLTACQNAPQDARAKGQPMPKPGQQFDGKGRHFEKHGHHHAMRGEFRHGGQDFRRGPMNAEQKAKFEKMQAERKAKFDALQKACEGKAGQNISVKIGEQSFTGTCQVNFRPDRPQPKTVPTNAPAPAAAPVKS